MNGQEYDVLRSLYTEPFLNQRVLAETSGHSIGIVNRSLKTLYSEGYIDKEMHLTEHSLALFRERSPRNAIILAAGYGMRMVPINNETPKGLLEIHGERLIDRLIRQLHEVGIYEIYVVVGFMQENFEYLIDTYGVKLIVNPEYKTKNNLFSLKLALDHLSNTYIIPSDIWCDLDPFNKIELYSWYMVSDLIDNESKVRVNRKKELIRINDHSGGNTMIGISYLQGEDSELLKQRILELSLLPQAEHWFWEEALYRHEGSKNKMITAARVALSSDVVEINTYEQLRELDRGSRHLNSRAICLISSVLNVPEEDIIEICVLKKGMTNRSFLFTCAGKKYIMRIPGEGTERIIDRKAEKKTYETIAELGLSDKVIYFDPDDGYRISEYIEDARVCDPLDHDDLERCMTCLREFHELAITTDHDFDLFAMIDLYESLWNGLPSVFSDHLETKQNVLSLRAYVESHAAPHVLTHIDAVPDNFLFSIDADGNERLHLIDWEYAGMQDPHVDIAMFGIYSLYDKEQIDALIDLYFMGRCDHATRTKIYCYIAICGLLWSNWAEYKRGLGVEFGGYALAQYRYAKDFYRIAIKEIEKDGT